MNVTPTGRIDHDGDRRTLRLSRTFSAPIEDVWAAVTDPVRMERWIGTWAGDPTAGVVAFRMTAEGEDVPVEEVKIRECDPPRRLAVTSTSGAREWHLEVDLAEQDGVTTLSFSQPDLDPEDGPSVGPGWEYYLDRLVATVTDADVTAVDFDRYYPAMEEYYRSRL